MEPIAWKRLACVSSETVSYVKMVNGVARRSPGRPTLIVFRQYISFMLFLWCCAQALCAMCGNSFPFSCLPKRRETQYAVVSTWSDGPRRRAEPS